MLEEAREVGAPPVARKERISSSAGRERERLDDALVGDGNLGRVHRARSVLEVL